MPLGSFRELCCIHSKESQVNYLRLVMLQCYNFFIIFIILLQFVA